jgi:hypothetical protein
LRCQHACSGQDRLGRLTVDEDTLSLLELAPSKALERRDTRKRHARGLLPGERLGFVREVDLLDDRVLSESAVTCLVIEIGGDDAKDLVPGLEAGRVGGDDRPSKIVLGDAWRKVRMTSELNDGPEKDKGTCAKDLLGNCRMRLGKTGIISGERGTSLGQAGV